jgi:hypothetical protein
MTTEIETATPAEQVAAEQVQQVESNSSEATTEQTQEVQQEQTQEQKDEAKKEPWFQKRINEQTRKYYEAQREAQALKERLAQYEQRQQYQATEDQTQQQTVDIDALADKRAAQLLAQRSFNEACNKVYEVGTKELQGFDSAVSNLQLVGPNLEFLDAVTASDAGHKILHHLGQLENLAEAERILNLPPVQMGRELAKLEIKLNAPPPPKPVSKAPEPIKPIGAGGVSDSGLRDDLPIDEWMRRNAQKR